MKILPGKTCVSCGRLSNACTNFACPACGNGKIVRCLHCREISNIYRCPDCGFEGP